MSESKGKDKDSVGRGFECNLIALKVSLLIFPVYDTHLVPFGIPGVNPVLVTLPNVCDMRSDAPARSQR